MVILHKIEDFLFELFPKAKQAGNNESVLVEEIKQFYSHMGGGNSTRVYRGGVD